MMMDMQSGCRNDRKRKEENSMASFKEFLKRKDIVITPQRYLIEALGAMAQGLFASLLIGTIIKTLGQQTGLDVLVDLGGYATAMSGPAMACAIGWALHCPPLVLFSLITVGYSANALGGAGGPLAVLIIAIVAAELGKAVSKETKIDILATPLVTIFAGVGLSMLIAAPMVKRHYGVRTDRFKLIHFYNDIDTWELYDLKEDPTEMHNLYGNSDYASIVDSLKETMLELQEQYNDPVRFSPERDRD